MADEKDDFDTVFDQVVAEMDNPDKAPPADDLPASDPPADDPPAKEPAKDDPPADPADPPADPPADDPPAPAPVPADPPAPKPAAPAAAKPPAPPTEPQETPEQKAAREEFEKSIAPYEPTPEEAAALEQFKKDFPNEAVAVEARLKSVDRDINARVYKAVQTILSQVDPRLQNVEEHTSTAAMAQHVTALHTAHKDYDEVIAKVPAWIETLPSYVKAAAKAVYDGGTTQEVIDLVNDYKKANPSSAAPPAPKPAAPAKPKPDGADLVPTSSRRPVTTPKGESDPNDFDGAFAEAAAELG